MMRHHPHFNLDPKNVCDISCPYQVFVLLNVSYPIIPQDPFLQRGLGPPWSWTEAHCGGSRRLAPHGGGLAAHWRHLVAWLDRAGKTKYITSSWETFIFIFSLYR